MNAFVKNILAKFRKSQSGFTLVELLVVVGIIVALAATIVPAVAQFAGSGEEAAQKSEFDNIQTTIDTYMADNAETTVDTPPSNSENVFDGGTSSTLDLSLYMRETTTSYYYCWDATGKVSTQHIDASAAC